MCLRGPHPRSDRGGSFDASWIRFGGVSRVNENARVERCLIDGARGVEARVAEFVAQELPGQPTSIVLCGAGVLGRSILREMRCAGLEPRAFADNAPALAGTVIDGVPVMSVPDAVATHRGAAFVTTVYNPSAIARQLQGLGVRPSSTRALLLAHPDSMAPHCAMGGPDAVLQDASGAIAGGTLWADEASRVEYEHQIRWQLLLPSPALPASATGDIYFPPDIVRLGTSECFVDCGAFDGDSIRAFLQRSAQTFERIDAIEPDPANQAKLRQWLGAIDPGLAQRIVVHPFAAGAKHGTLRFASGAGAGSTITDNGDVEVSVAPLDEILAANPPSFVKVDVEGAEHDVIAGARSIIAQHAPVLAIVLYHRASDLWTIPLALRALRPDYRLYLRRYAEDCWETVCYAVPAHRCVAPAE